MLVVIKDQGGSCEKVNVSREDIQIMDRFSCLGVMISTDGGMGEVAHRILEGRKAWGGWKSCGKRI